MPGKDSHPTIAQLLELMMQSIQHRQQGELLPAIACLDQALHISPAFLPCLSERVELLAQLERYEEALEDINRCIAYSEESEELRLQRTHVKTSALASLDARLALHPQQTKLLFEKATVLLLAQDYLQAAEVYRELLALTPQHASAHNNLGNALMALDQTEAAANSYKTAVQQAPDNAQAWFNLGTAHVQLGEFASALQAFETAKTHAPDLIEAEFESAQCHLFQGNFSAGWRLYESRWQTRQLAPHRLGSGAAAWRGESPLTGKTLLLWAEQGYGDTLQFLRFLPHLQALGGNIILRLQAPLLRLVAQSALGQGIALIADNAPIPPHDAQCPLMSLPWALKRYTPFWDSVYLRANDIEVQAWREHLLPSHRQKIGVVWAGRTIGLPNRSRDVPFAALLPLAQIDADFYALQKPIRPEDKESMQGFPRLRDVSAELSDFAATAALIENLDLVISADTAVAHLAGAMGKPCWLMLRHASEWRWQRDTVTTPWYPQTRLFRQPQAGAWHKVIEAICAELLRKQMD